MGKLTVYINDGYKKNDGTCAIYVYLHLLGKKLKINTKVTVDPDQWDYKKSRVKGKAKEAKDKNLIIDKCLARLNDIFVRYRLQHKELTPELLKKEYKTPSTYIDFYDFFERAKLEQSGLLTDNTLRMHGSVLGKMRRFKKTLMFSEITVDLISDYRRYLKYTLKNNENTIQKNMAVFKAYINLAIRHNVIQENPFKYVKLKRITPSRVFLDPDEFANMRLKYTLGWFAPNLQTVLRYYLFSCFTGLRLVDVKRVTHQDIIGETLVFHPQKTKNKVVRIPLTKPALKLIKDAHPLRSHGLLFDTYTDPVTNRHLKRIADGLGIDKELTFHSSRHTFATMFLRKTKNIAALQKLLGHTNISETMIYAHVLNEDVEKEMDVFNGDEFVL